MKTKRLKAPPRREEADAMIPATITPAAETPAEIIFRIAERYSIHCRDIVRFPQMIEQTGLPLSVIERNINNAENLRKEKLITLQAQLKVRNARIMAQWPREAPDVAEAEPKPRQLGEPRIEAPAKIKKPKPEPKPPTVRPTYEGFAITSVIRRLGAEGWTIQEADAVLKQINVAAAFGTVRAQILAGAKGERGEPAQLSAKSLEKLNKLRKKLKK